MNLDLGYTRLILEKCRERGVLRNQAAYILATAKWETAHTMRPIKERGSQEYLTGKDYWPFIGRGFVQLTWEDNYRRAGEEVGLDLVGDPDAAMDPRLSADILVVGMMEGWFTGKALPDYVTLQRSDFLGARRVVNGTDKRSEIAAIAREYDGALLGEGYGVEALPKPTSTTPQQPESTMALGTGALAARIILYILSGNLAISGFDVDMGAGTITLDVEQLLNVVLGGGGILATLGWRKWAKAMGGKT